jgi:hypothetical protein
MSCGGTYLRRMLTSFLLPRSPVHVTIRIADTGDRSALERVAALDSARVPDGVLVVAAVAGSIQAALPISGGQPIANPFVPTADLVELLETRATQLRDLELPDNGGAALRALWHRLRVVAGTA